MIKIQNIYYMLSYAFETLSESSYRELATEEFEHLADLMATILARGIGNQLKRGLAKEYIRQEDILSTPRGKMDITSSIKAQTLMKKQIVCHFDEFSEDIYFNQILKSTVLLLIRSKEVTLERKKALKRVILFFNHVNEIDLSCINWASLKYHKNNANYKMLMNICYLIVEGMLLTTEDGDRKLQEYIDDQKMSSLYERFVRAYYRKHYPRLNASAAHIPWHLTETPQQDVIDFLPTMKSDITLKERDKTLIIDTKYYSKTMQTNTMCHKKTFHSNNMYQIFTYVKNKDINQTGQVKGVLLYAKTDEEITPDHDYHISGSSISVKTLDLSGDFEIIKMQLDALVKDMKS